MARVKVGTMPDHPTRRCARTQCKESFPVGTGRAATYMGRSKDRWNQPYIVCYKCAHKIARKE